jgi:hypothetical protein
MKVVFIKVGVINRVILDEIGLSVRLIYVYLIRISRIVMILVKVCYAQHV